MSAAADSSWRASFLGIARICALTSMAGSLVGMFFAGTHQIESPYDRALFGGLSQITFCVSWYAMVAAIIATLITPPGARPKLATLFAFCAALAIALLIKEIAAPFGIKS